MTFKFNPNYFSEFLPGVYTVLVTPFEQDNVYNVAYDEIKKWVREQLSFDIAGIVIHGTTSESPTLTQAEKIKITQCVIDEYEKYYTDNPESDVKMVVIGTGTNCTRGTIENSICYKDYCHAIMVVMPYYNKPQQKGLVEHFKTISHNPELSNKLIMLYNVPGRTGVNCLPETVRQIVDTCPNVKALKDAAGNPDQTRKTIELCGNTQLKVFSGDDKIIIDMLHAGVVGLVSVASNVFPSIFTEIVNSYLKIFFWHDPTLQDDSKIHPVYVYNSHFIAELCDALFCESNPVPVKRMMKLSGRYTSDAVRLPLVALDETLDEFVNKTYIKINALV